MNLLDKILLKVFGRDEEGERMAWTHACNENRKLGGRKGSILRHGRWWLHLRHPKGRDRSIGVEWLFGGKSWLGPGIEVHLSDGGGDSDITFMLCGLGCFFHVGLEGVLGKRFREALGLYKPPKPGEKYGHWQSRDIGIRVHDGTCWVDIWGKHGSWSKQDPKWQRFNFSVDPRDLFGKRTYESKVLEKVQVDIPLPEGTYPATMEIRLDSWGRSRWQGWPLRQEILRAHVDMLKPIPYPGKGENSWDCGEDGLHGSTLPARTVEEAIGKIVSSVLKTRTRRGVGHHYVPEKVKAVS